MTIQRGFDMSLVRHVFKEEYAKKDDKTKIYTISATLTRFGGIAVFVYNPEMNLVWQGDNIIEARTFLREKVASFDRNFEKSHLTSL